MKQVEPRTDKELILKIKNIIQNTQRDLEVLKKVVEELERRTDNAENHNRSKCTIRGM